MKTFLLILSVFALASCKGPSNKTSGSQKVSAYVQKAYMTIPHNDDSSVLREKLLHLKLNSLLKQSSAVKIEKDDQFKFANETFQTNSAEQFDYEKHKESSAEVIVSYSDRMDIFFVPTGLLREQASSDLNLKTEEGRVLSWMPGTPATLLKGQTYYLLSASKDDLLDNDRKFFITKLPASTDMNTVHRFSPFQKIILTYSIQSFLPETSIVSVSGGAQGICKRDMMEAGLCEPCMAKIEKNTGKYIKQLWSLEQAGLALLINGKEVHIQQFKPEFNEKNGLMTMVLDLRGLALPGKEVSVQIVKPLVHVQKKTVDGFQYTGNCRSHSGVQSVLDLTPLMEMSYEMEIQGRNIQI